MYQSVTCCLVECLIMLTHVIVCLFVSFLREGENISLWEVLICYYKIVQMLESIQGTCRLSLKMGRGDEQKPLMHCINIDFRSSEMPPLPNNGIFKSICWAFADPLNRLVTTVIEIPDLTLYLQNVLRISLYKIVLILPWKLLNYLRITCWLFQE